MTEKKADIFSNVKYDGDFIFAFDNINDKEKIEEKLKLWRKYNKESTTFYVLCGFYDTTEKDLIDTFERIKILMKYQCCSYIMRYEKCEKSIFKDLYTRLAEYCNCRAIYKKMSLNEYLISKKFYNLIDFMKREYKDIYDKYFFIKYEDFK